MSIIGIGEVSAADCNLGVVEHCTVSVSQTLPFGIYNFTDISATGSIIINANNLVLDGNGSYLIGNTSTNSRGINAFNKANITIKNFNIYGYRFGIQLGGTTFNTTITNCNFSSNLTYAGIYVQQHGDNNITKNNFLNILGTAIIFEDSTYSGKGSEISNNIFSNISSNSIFTNPAQQLNIFSNTFYNLTTAISIRLVSTQNNNVFNNTFISYGDSNTNTIYIYKNNNTVFDSNYVYNKNSTATIVRIDLANNITIKNNLYNNTECWDVSGGSNNIQIYNDTCSNQSRSGYAMLSQVANTINFSFYNNRLLSGYQGSYIYGGNTNMNFYNNYFSGFILSTASSGLGFVSGISSDNIVNVFNNTFFNNSRGIVVGSYNINVYNNIVNWSDVGIRIGINTNNVSVYNNIVDNTLRADDGYNAGIVAEYNITNTSIYNNTIINYGSAGIYVRQSENINIFNNTLSQATDTFKILLNFSRGDEDYFTFGIGVLELYKGWSGDSKENRTNKTFSDVLSYNSSDINIKDNKFSNTVQTYLFVEGNYNLTSDILPNVNNWYRKFRIVPEQMDTQEFYNNLNFSDLSEVPRRDKSRIYAYYSYACGNQLVYCWINLTIGQTNMTFLNYNHTTAQYNLMYNLTNKAVNVSIFSASAYYPYNDIKNVSNNVILASNVDNYSISLLPNQQIQVGDFTNLYFNITNFPSGTNIKSLFDWNFSLYDPDSLFKIGYLIIDDDTSLTDESDGVFKNYSSGSLTPNFSNILLTDGTWYWEFYVLDNKSNTTGSGWYSFVVHGQDIVGNINPYCVYASNGGINALSELPNWLLLLSVIVAALIIIGLLGGMGYAIYSGLEVKDLLPFVVTLILTVIIIIIGIVVLTAVC